MDWVMEVMAKDGGSQSGNPWPRLTALYSDARGENSCQTVGLSRPLSRDATWKEKAAAGDDDDDDDDIIICLDVFLKEDVVNALQ